MIPFCRFQVQKVMLGPRPSFELRRKAIDHFAGPLGADDDRVDRLASRRHLVEAADVHLAVLRQGERVVRLHRRRA